MSKATLSDGRSLNYVRIGNTGKPVVLLHGYLDSHMSFFRLFEALSADHILFVPDQRGHGDSDAAASYEISGFTQDAIEFIEQLHLGPMHLVGHSLGGIVAQRVARARPDLVLSLALIATARSAAGNQALQAIVPLLPQLSDPVPESVAREFQASTTFAPLPEDVFYPLLVETLKVRRAVWGGALFGLLKEPPPDDPPSSLPSLVLYGREDSIFGENEQERLHRHFIKSLTKEFPETGHAPNWERPVETADALIHFWNTVELDQI
jgi:pimeloyl-ACP methyl ester carboxylesterase